MSTNKKLKHFWQAHNDKIVLTILLMVFTAYALFIALNLKTGIIPDEDSHFIFAKHYATTIGIPPDTDQTAAIGWYIQQNPFLFHWIMGRFINLITLVQPAATDWQVLVILRVINVLFALGTVFFCYRLSIDVIRHKWWTLLPVFMLTNILMFVFLAGGLNYDNLANLCSMASLLFFARALQRKRFVINSILWIILIGLGTLVKYPILPLAFAMGAAWVTFVIINRKSLLPLGLTRNHLPLIAVFVLIIVGNFSIYGINLIRYQSLTPPCNAILSEARCALSPFVGRHNEIALQPKLTVSSSMQMGFPSPLRYVFYDWIWHILLRSFGVVGHQSYFPLHLILFYQILFYWTLFLSFFNLVYHQRVEPPKLYLLGVMLFYALTLLIHNYNSELVYGFQQISLQGRYIFPVIGVILVLFTSVLMKVPSKIILWMTLLFTLGLSAYGGTITILLGYDTIFSGWFV